MSATFLLPILFRLSSEKGKVTLGVGVSRAGSRSTVYDGDSGSLCGHAWFQLADGGVEQLADVRNFLGVDDPALLPPII
jgi:hypothetical protein